MSDYKWTNQFDTMEQRAKQSRRGSLGLAGAAMVALNFLTLPLGAFAQLCKGEQGHATLVNGRRSADTEGEGAMRSKVNASAPDFQVMRPEQSL